MQHLYLNDLGCGYEEAAGEEHEAGEHVSKDFGANEEAGLLSTSLRLFLNFSFRRL